MGGTEGVKQRSVFLQQVESCCCGCCVFLSSQGEEDGVCKKWVGRQEGRQAVEGERGGQGQAGGEGVEGGGGGGGEQGGHSGGGQFVV